MKHFLNILAFLAALAALSQVSSLEFNLGMNYYVLLFVLFILLMAVGGKIKVNLLMAWLACAGLLSILLNDIPTFFMPYERLAAFILVMGLVGPLIRNSALQAFRIKLFETINILIVVMVIISFLGITLGTPLMTGRGGFVGVFSHSMILGPMSAIAMLVTIYWAGSPNKNIVRWLHFGLAAIAFITCVAAGSRAALVAGFAGGLLYYYKMNQGKLTRFTRVIFVVASIVTLTFPFWEHYTERLMGKMIYGEEQGSLLTTRTNLWTSRIEEFKSSPIIGVGFGAIDTSISTNFDILKGQVEPGSSWLAVISMTGLLGALPFALLLLNYLNFFRKANVNKHLLALLGGLIFFFMVHMMAEGYIFSAGSGLFFYFWLVMGMIEQECSLRQNPRGWRTI